MSTGYSDPAPWYKERNEKIYEQHLGHMTIEQIRLYWNFDSNGAVRSIIKAEEKRHGKVGQNANH